MPTATTFNPPGGIVNRSLLEQDTDIFAREIYAKMGMTYNETLDKCGLRMLQKMTNFTSRQLKNRTPKWYEEGRLLQPPVLSAGATRSLVDGTTDAAGTYVTVTIDTSQVTGGAGKYRSNGQVREQVIIDGQFVKERFTIHTKIAPTNSTTHKIVLGFPTGATTTPAELATLCGSGAKLILFSATHNSQSTPNDTPMQTFEQFSGSFQEIADKWSLTGEADSTEFVVNFNIGGTTTGFFANKYAYNMAELHFIKMNRALFYGDQATYVYTDNNIEATTSTDGLIMSAYKRNTTSAALSDLTGGSVNDIWSYLTDRVEFARANNSFAKQGYLCGANVMLAIQKAFTTLRSAKVLDVSENETVTYGGVTTPIANLGGNAYSLNGFTMVFMPMGLFDDTYGPSDTRNYAVCFPIGDARIYEEGSNSTVERPTICEGYMLGSDGRRVKMLVSGPFSFAGKHPNEDFTRTNRAAMRTEFNFSFMMTKQFQLIVHA